MTASDMHGILASAIEANTRQTFYEISLDFGLDSVQELCCNVYVFSNRSDRVNREIVDSFASYDPDATIENMISRINKYRGENE